MNWLDKLERKYGRYSIKGLMTYIVGITGFVYFVSMFSSSLENNIALIPELVMKGQVWRLVTYIFMPPGTSIVWIAFVLYFYYMIGSSLENVWGSFRLNVYYFVGMLGTAAAVFLTGGIGTSVYLNLSLFLAYAHLFPNDEILLFFILPVKVKYLGWLNWAFLIYSAVTSGSIGGAVVVLMPIVNFFLFFFEDFINYSKYNRKYHKNKVKFRAQVIDINSARSIHKCIICGRTEKDDPKLEFRYCTDCDGYKEYCMEHLKTHEHIKDGSTRE